MGKYEYSISLVVGGKVLIYVVVFYRLLCICVNRFCGFCDWNWIFFILFYDKIIDYDYKDNIIYVI